MTAPLITNRTVTPDFHLYELEAGDLKLSILFDRIYDERGAIWCELTVTAMNRTLIPPTRTNLLNSTRGGWRAHSELLESRYDSVEWGEVFRDIVGEAIVAFREGEQAVELVPMHPTQDDMPYRPFLIEPLIASSGITVLYAGGGLGKSLLGLAGCLSVVSGMPLLGGIPEVQGPALYFDYEDDPELHHRRLAGLMTGAGITELAHPIHHKRLVAKVSQSQMEMRKIAVESGAVLAVVDSIGMGRGGDANSAEDTIRLFRSLRSLNLPVLAIDHLSSEDVRKGEVNKPYGSVYTINAGRLLWGAQLMPSSTATVKRIKLTNTKGNHVKKQADIAVEVKWIPSDDDDQVFKSIVIDFKDEMWQEFEVTVWEQMYRVLKFAGDWMTSVELADTTGIAQGTVLQELRRHEDELDTHAGGGRGRAKSVRLKVDNPQRNLDMEE